MCLHLYKYLITFVILNSVTFVNKYCNMDFLQLFEDSKETALHGRYIALHHIEDLLINEHRQHRTKVEGLSVLGRPIYTYTIGTGAVRILMWSQMHGNESTSTKAIFDLLKLLDSKSEVSTFLLDNFTFCIIPMLNPDGAFAYTRTNANGIDLNRDLVNLSQPETQILKSVLLNFQPNYCYNLHDQRTIFGAGESGRPATISFLSPAFDDSLEMNECRLKAIRVINAMNSVLQKIIPGQVGRFDDAFNLNCVGDNFQNLGFPTILIEAGHYQDDYQREKTRYFFFIALISGLLNIYEIDVVDDELIEYLNIPENKQNFRDIIYENVNINYDGIVKNTNFAIQYQEVLLDDAIEFVAQIAEVGELNNLFGHVTIDACQATYSDELTNTPRIGQKADFILDKTTIVVNGLIKM